MGIVARMDDWGRPAWIGLTILGFIVFWPAGVAALVFLIGSGRMGCCSYGAGQDWAGRGWHERWHERMEAKRARWAARHGTDGRHGAAGRPTGNRAFDDYRAETLRRLEEEEKEFREFLDRLRFAKDKAEFDEFLANRRPVHPPEPTAG
jgi:hypothetical protein